MEMELFLKHKPKRSSKPGPPPLPATDPLPVKNDSVSDSVFGANEIGRDDGLDFELNRTSLLQGIILTEVLGRPKGSSRFRK